MQDFYIAIEGVIGVGKTSLARYLQQELNASVLFEVFEENPFLANFYQDRVRYAFQTQVFFLLSRYDQQRRISQSTLPLISDYIFAKDRIFAHQNLANDELKTYERVYEALAKNITKPNLVVYLRAETPTLMAQIARRDRPYERNMENGYIDGLRVAYDQFFAEYESTPLLTIDTSELDFVEDEQDRAYVIDLIRGALGFGPQQAALPGLNQVPSIEIVENDVKPSDIVDSDASQALDKTARRLGDYQNFHREFDRIKGFNTDLFLNFALLQEEIGELANALVRWSRIEPAKHGSGDTHVDLQNEFADVLAYIFKLANYTGIDLESAYLAKMQRNMKRSWHDTLPVNEES
jgi:deoxyadenosine/deoxycytidine kinase/NTP pyrophosphatase (non-canonical NTP hydrolase)